MSPETTPAVPREPVTLDEVKIKAERVRDLASTQAKQTVKDVAAQPMVRSAAIAAGVVAAAVSLAFFFGTRSGQRRASRQQRRQQPPQPPRY